MEQETVILVADGGGGAGAGIGGKGGKGGNANININGDTTYGDGSSFCGKGASGLDGEAGENCGNINIYNSMTIYAYGGGGGSANAGTNSGAGGGAGGYPAAGIGGGGAGGGGGDHAAAAGGYSGGCGQPYIGGSVNGMSVKDKNPTYGAGGAYFESGHHSYTGKNMKDNSLYAFIGGQGAIAQVHNSQGGDGGVAGKGGIVKVSGNANIYAYNGNKYTDGTDYMNGNNQLEIYAQNGVLREIRKYDIWWNLKENRYVSFFKEIMGTTVNSNIESFTACSASNYIEHENYLIREASNCSKSGYKNKKNNLYQGVGSGAGYIELSNGIYTVDVSMN